MTEVLRLPTSIALCRKVQTSNRDLGKVWGYVEGGGGEWELVIPKKPRVERFLRREWEAAVLNAALRSS